MAGQGWNFDVLGHDARNDLNYDQIQGALWADLENADELGEHWSSDTWNEPHAADHVADRNTTSGHPQSQHTSQHTSHIQVSPRSPSQHMNVSEYRPANSRPAATPYSRHDPLPAAQSETSHHDTSRDLNSPYRPATFTNLPPPQNSTGRSGIESFLRRPNQEEEDRNNALNQSILDVGSQAIDSDGEPDNMAPSRHSRSRRAADEFQVDLTQSPVNSATQQSRTRKRSSISDEGASGSAKKRVKGPPVVVDEDDVFEDEAPSAEAELLQAQQADALKMQETNKEDAAAVKIGKRNCIICLESYTNATTAICGHIFCHECLTRALMASEKNNDRGKGNCPACRKAINRKSAKEVIPISFMKKSAFKTKGRQAHNR